MRHPRINNIMLLLYKIVMEMITMTTEVSDWIISTPPSYNLPFVCLEKCNADVHSWQFDALGNCGSTYKNVFLLFCGFFDDDKKKSTTNITVSYYEPFLFRIVVLLFFFFAALYDERQKIYSPIRIIMYNTKVEKFRLSQPK